MRLAEAVPSVLRPYPSPHVRHGKHGQVPANAGAPRGIFRSQYEWTNLIQAGTGWTVTRVGSGTVHHINVASSL